MALRALLLVLTAMTFAFGVLTAGYTKGPSARPRWA